MTAELVILGDVEKRLAAAESIEDFVDVANMAKVAEELARRGNLGIVAQNQAVEYRVLAYSGAADLIDQMNLKRGSKSPRDRGLPTTQVVQRWRDVAGGNVPGLGDLIPRRRPMASTRSAAPE